MPKVTVYVRVPTVDSLKTDTYNHSFIQLGDSPTEVYGFEPAKTGHDAARQGRQ